MFTSRSTNSYIRVLRRVTLQPIGWFSRSLKFEIALRDFVITAFWPAISARSAAAESTFLRSATPSPTPILSTTLSSTGTCMGFLYPNWSTSALRTTSSKCLRRRAVTRSCGAFGALPSPVSGLAACVALAALAAFSPFSPFSPFWPFSAGGAWLPLRLLSAFLASGCFGVSAIDFHSRALGKPHLLVAHRLEAYARRLAVLGIGERDIRQMD